MPEAMSKYVYGVVPASAPAPPVVGIGDAPVSVIVSDDTAAIVSDVPAGQLEAGRAELMVHAHVLEQALEASAVLPMRFGVVMDDADSVRRDLLERFHEELVPQLAELEGKVELHVRVVYEERALMTEVVAATRRSPSDARPCMAARRTPPTTSASRSASSWPRAWSASANATARRSSRRSRRWRWPPRSAPPSTNASRCRPPFSSSDAHGGVRPRRRRARARAGGTHARQVHRSASGPQLRRTSPPGVADGLFSGLLTLPLAPVRGVVWVAEQVAEEADRQLYDEGQIRSELLQLELDHDDGLIGDEERAELEDALLERLAVAQRRAQEERRLQLEAANDQRNEGMTDG